MKCLRKDCERESKTRGLCPSHYSTLIKRVSHKGKTFQEFIKLGLCLPSSSELSGCNDNCTGCGCMHHGRTGRKEQKVFYEDEDMAHHYEKEYRRLLNV